MKHPIHFVMGGSAISFLIGAVMFILGIVKNSASLKLMGAWFGIAAFAIASLPLLTLAFMLLVEKLRRNE